MPQVHPTAIVDPQARLAEDVVVGPQCIITGEVRVGPRCRLLHRVTLQGPITLGSDNTLYPEVCLGMAPQDLKYDPVNPGAGLVIGDRNTFREGVTIHRATGSEPTTVGHENYFMVNSHLGHDVKLGNHCMIVNGVLVGGHVHIGDRVLLGGGCGIHQFCRVGRLSIISGCNGITQDLPPFCALYNTRFVGSLNIVGLRRAGLREHITPLKAAFDLLYRSSHTLPRAVELIRHQLGEDPLCRELADFVADSRRGITPYGGTRGMIEAT
jgi:UDP-N-acetylglucosamine acyltransferase